MDEPYIVELTTGKLDVTHLFVGNLFHPLLSNDVNVRKNA